MMQRNAEVGLFAKPSKLIKGNIAMKELNLKHFRLLVVDDDSSTLDLFRQVLSRVKTDQMIHSETEESESKLFRENASSQSLKLFDVVTCQQGDEAVDAVKNSIQEDRPFSVAFIDIRLPPGPDGIWAAEHIRTLDSNVEIVIITGYPDAHLRNIVHRVSPAHKLLYLQKPFHSQEIYQFAFALSMKWHTECELRNALNAVKDNEKELIKHKSSLEKVNRQLMETNQALSVLARNIDKDKELLEKRVIKIISSKIMPIIKELQIDQYCKKREADLEVLAAYLDDLTPGLTLHHDISNSLSDQEMRVMVMIKNGLTSQRIANMLHISLHTVKTHRKNIRKKLKIQNSKVNLASYLKSKFKE